MNFYMWSYMDLINNREMAVAIWGLIFLAWAFKNKGFRDSLRSLLVVFMSKKIMMPFCLLIGYVFGVVFLLKEIGIWDFSQIKNTIVWFFSYAFFSFINSNKVDDNPNCFKDALKENLKIIVFVEFLVSFYTFSLVWELILVPLVTFLTVVHVVSSADERYVSVYRCIEFLMVLMGFSIFIYAIYRLVFDFSEFAKIQTLLDFVVPVILSIFLFPAVFLLNAYMVYERAFISIDLSIKGPNLRKYAKKKAIMRYGFNLSGLKRWANSLCRMNNLKDEKDIDKLCVEVDRLMAEKNNPPVVPFEKGWSPYIYCSVLKDMGLVAGDYNNLYEDEWGASSSYLEIGKGLLPNNIAYYLEGDRCAVKKLKLVLNVNDRRSAYEAHNFLCECASTLHFYALGVEINKYFKDAIINGEDKEVLIKSKVVMVKLNHWASNRGYSIEFSISSM